MGNGYVIPGRVHRNEVIEVRSATLIPAGMQQFRGKAAGYMQVAPAYEAVVTGLGTKAIVPGRRRGHAYGHAMPPPGAVRSVQHDVILSMVRRGVPLERARAIVTRVGLRLGARHNRWLHRGWIRHRAFGMGDTGPGQNLAVPEGVLAYANETQGLHKSLIDKYAAASAADRPAIRNEIDGLYAGWTDYALGVKNDAPPYTWNRANPTDAVLIAVRDDIRNTLDLIDAGKAQAALAKQIKLMTLPGGILPSMPKLDVPWYVWAGGALTAAIAAKAAHLF